jgi:hypothetical protein
MRRTIRKLSKEGSPAPTHRSRVTNGRALFVEADGRSAWSRRYKNLVEAHVSDLGGVDGLSEAKKQLIRRAATIEAELERQEGALATGESIDLDAFGRASNSLRRILESIGLERAKKEFSLTEYLAAIPAKQESK